MRWATSRSIRTTPDGICSKSRLIDIFKSRADRVVFVKGDPQLEFRVIAQAIDIAHGAGIDKVGLMTPKVEAGQ